MYARIYILLCSYYFAQKINCHIFNCLVTSILKLKFVSRWCKMLIFSRFVSRENHNFAQRAMFVNFDLIIIRQLLYYYKLNTYIQAYG